MKWDFRLTKAEWLIAPIGSIISAVFTIIALRNLWKVDKKLFYYSILTAAIAISFLVLNDIPFLEHLTAASMVVWSIMAGLKLATNKI